MDNALAPVTTAALVPAISGRRLLNAFLAGRSPRTLDAYRGDLDAFRAWTGEATAEDAARRLLAHGHAEANALALEYRAALVERGLAAATINRRLAALRSLVALARTLGFVPWRLEVADLKAAPYRDTRGPGRAGFALLLAELDTRPDAKGRRDRAILRLLYDLALRRAEVTSLDVADVDLTAGTVAVLGKGRTAREALTLPAETSAALRAWLEVRGSEPGPLFVNFGRNRRPGRLTGRSVARVVEALGSRVGLRVRPHGLRHAAITAALDATNGNTRAAQRFSRHRDARTLLRYDDNRLDLAGDVARLVAAGVR